MKSKQLVSLGLSAVLLCAPLTSAFAADDISASPNSTSFSDVTEVYDWAKEAIQKFAEANIVGGIGDGLFAPESNITREQLAKILTLAFDLPKVSKTFEDVSADKWSADYIARAAGLIVNDGKTFEPERTATREELAVAAVRALGRSSDTPKTDSKDITDFKEITASLQNEVLIAADLGIMGGYPDGSFKPQSAVTRAEAVVILNRALAIKEAEKADLAVVNADLAKFGSALTLSSNTAGGEITDALLKNLLTGTLSEGVTASFAIKSDEHSLFQVKDGKLFFNGNTTSVDKTATLTLILTKGNASAAKDIKVTSVGTTASFESYRYQFSYLTGEYTMNALDQNQVNIGLQVASMGDLHWYYTAPVKQDRFDLASIIIRKDGKPVATSSIPTGVVSAIVGDKGTLDKIYYTPSDMALAVQNGKDGAMITDLTKLEKNEAGADYTYYRASFSGETNGFLTFNPINKDGRAEIAKVEGENTYYSADPNKRVFVKLADGANIALMEGAVTDATVKSAKRGSLSDLLASTDGGKNYVADFVLNKDGEIISLFFYQTPEENLVKNP